MKLSQDVAGASVMAAAVACPELFVNILATFFTEGDVGIGTVVGTGLFNILLVPGLCILMADQKVVVFSNSTQMIFKNAPQKIMK